MPNNRLSGVLAHPTSFPSRHGIGDLGQSAYDFIDFLVEAKQTLWQILPLNPTSFGDSPYQSFSTFAGNPLLISPDLLIKEELLAEYDLWGAPHNGGCKVDYGEVISYKDRLFRTAFNNFNNREQKAAFERFCKHNYYWLNEFCLFMALKQHFIAERRHDLGSAEFERFKQEVKGFLTKDEINDYYYGAVWQSWPAAVARREETALAQWRGRLAHEIEYLAFLQYMFFLQWEKLKGYANKNGVLIVGDVPIFVALDSADTWSAPDMFCLDENGYPTAVAGVPPDYFSKTGQLWGNPLYDWQKHENDGYNWWTDRVKSALTAADIIRLDHFRGFESYWAVPLGEKTAVKGKWLKGPGRALFDRMKERLGNLPIIAEDLGIITDDVEELRDSLGLPGMRVMQFGFDGSRKNLHCPHNYCPNTVAYTGTHDNDTSRGWYESTSAEVQDRFRRYHNTSGEDPAWDLIRAVMLCCADWAVIPVQDILSLGNDARMNFPGKMGGNWQFRYTDGQLTDELAERLRYLSELSDRNAVLERNITDGGQDD